VAVLRQIAAVTRPTAILCYNDLAAMGLLAAAHQVAWQVPRDLSIVGYDNIPLSAFTIPALTTVHQPTQKLGRLAVDSCLAALVGTPIPDAVLTGELIIRDSASAPRAAG
jgi:LacI family transcriptional regulator